MTNYWISKGILILIFIWWSLQLWKCNVILHARFDLYLCLFQVLVQYNSKISFVLLSVICISPRIHTHTVKCKLTVYIYIIRGEIDWQLLIEPTDFNIPSRSLKNTLTLETFVSNRVRSTNIITGFLGRWKTLRNYLIYIV